MQGGGRIFHIIFTCGSVGGDGYCVNTELHCCVIGCKCRANHLTGRVCRHIDHIIGEYQEGFR